MNKIKSYFLLSCLSIFLINQSIISASAVPFGGILKGLKGGSKFFKGGSKVIKPGDDLLKKLHDLKISKSMTQMY